jgi:DNA-binding NtrC family response regulator
MTHVLIIIHSSPTLRKILSFSAQRIGWQCEEYAEIEEAYIAHAQSSVSPRIILIDASSAKAGYTDMIHALQKSTPSMEIVLCLSRNRMFDRARRKFSGIRHIIIEPVRIEEFTEVLRSIK